MSMDSLDCSSEAAAAVECTTKHGFVNHCSSVRAIICSYLCAGASQHSQCVAGWWSPGLRRLWWTVFPECSSPATHVWISVRTTQEAAGICLQCSVPTYLIRWHLRICHMCSRLHSAHNLSLLHLDFVLYRFAFAEPFMYDAVAVAVLILQYYGIQIMTYQALSTVLSIASCEVTMI